MAPRKEVFERLYIDNLSYALHIPVVQEAADEELPSKSIRLEFSLPRFTVEKG